MVELDNPIWNAIRGPHTHLAAAGPLGGVYDPDVAPFAGFEAAGPSAFEAIATLAGPGRTLAFFTPGMLVAPDGWEMVNEEPLEQMVCGILANPRGGPEPIVPLGQADVPAMLALTAATEPGPFSAGTHRFGRYQGIRAEGGGLAAMAGERLRTARAVEVSAVCTAPDQRGKGLAARMVHAVATRLIAEGLTPFLHVRPANTPAITVYEKLGFRRRMTMRLTVLKVPES